MFLCTYLLLLIRCISDGLSFMYEFVSHILPSNISCDSSYKFSQTYTMFVVSIVGTEEHLNAYATSRKRQLGSGN